MFKKIFGVLMVFGLVVPAYAKSGPTLQLKQIHPNTLGISNPTDYEILLDQIFQIENSEFKHLQFFFAAAAEGAGADDGRSAIPKVFTVRDKQVLNSEVLPGIESGWNLAEVKAVALDDKKSSATKAVFLAILNFEPPAGPQGAWDQAFVFTVTVDGKISFDHDLNEKLAHNDPAKKIKTIKALKKFLN
jgi:hypothetical protein